MGYILTVYSRHAYKEYLLPAEQNIDYKITLFKELFQLREDIVLRMENTGGEWRVLPDEWYTLTYTAAGRESAFEQPLRDSDICSLMTDSGEKITVIVKVSTQFFRVFDKFDLGSRRYISIGTAPENTICYDFMHIVSREHAVIQRDGEDYIIEDKSTNGLFVNARRVQGSQLLRYGDRKSVV